MFEGISKCSKKNVLISLLFVLSAVIGIAGMIQQLAINSGVWSPVFDLQNLSVIDCLKQLFFHLQPFFIGVIALLIANRKIMLGKSLDIWGQSFKISTLVYAVAVFFGIFLLTEVASYYLNLRTYRWNENFQWQWMLISVIIFVFVQVAFEELIFRSFLPAIFHRFGLTIKMSFVLASIVFGLLHSNNPEVETYGTWFILLYILQGLFLSFLVYKTANLALSIGYHFANNFVSLFFVTNTSQVLKFPTFVVNESPINLLEITLQLIITMVIFLIANRLIFSRKQTVKVND